VTLVYGSVCSGIEAVTAGWHGLDLRPRFFSEILSFPSRVLKHHYPDIPNLGDFTQIGAEHGPVDLLVGGTPCQSFSQAGGRAGLDDPRGHLAVEFLRLARRLRARWLVWENVPGVLSDDRGETFATLLGLMVELGYGVFYRVLDAQFFGVPQRRRRVFVVGYLGDWRPSAAVLLERPSMRRDPRTRGKAGTSVAAPAGGGAAPSDRDGRNDDVAHTLTAHHGRNSVEDTFALDDTARCIVRTGKAGASADQTFALGFHCTQDPISAEETTPLISAESSGCIGVFVASDGSATEAKVTSTLTPDGNRPARTMPVVLEPFAFDEVQITSAENRSTVSPGGPVSTVSPGGPVSTVSRTSRVSVAGGGVPRRLTPREHERCFGFPDDYTLIEGASDSVRYEALGNSMAVPVMRWLGERILAVEAILDRLKG
jgi:DNA (cytosine-5)-methyltransferase 1